MYGYHFRFLGGGWIRWSFFGGEFMGDLRSFVLCTVILVQGACIDWWLGHLVLGGYCIVEPIRARVILWQVLGLSRYSLVAVLFLLPVEHILADLDV